MDTFYFIWINVAHFWSSQISDVSKTSGITSWTLTISCPSFIDSTNSSKTAINWQLRKDFKNSGWICTLLESLRSPKVFNGKIYIPISANVCYGVNIFNADKKQKRNIYSVQESDIAFLIFIYFRVRRFFLPKTQYQNEPQLIHDDPEKLSHKK